MNKKTLGTIIMVLGLSLDFFVVLPFGAKFLANSYFIEPSYLSSIIGLLILLCIFGLPVASIMINTELRKHKLK